MNEILVSTITPCFRMKRYLKRFLDELPKQTIFNQMEVVLDHNEPDEEEISWIKDFQNKYPGRLKHIIINKVDPIGVSMNRCIRESSGEYLAIWNVDDLRTENSLELQYKKIKESDCGVVFGDFMIVRTFGATSGRLVDCSKFSDNDFFRSMVFGPFFMFKKSLCEKVGFFDEQFRSGADFDFSIRLSFHTKAAYTSGLLGYYLNEGLGASTRPNSVQALERTAIELRYGIFDKLDYDLVARATKYDINNCYLDGNFIKIDKYVPGYLDVLEKNKRLINIGLNKYIFKKIFLFKPIVRGLKKIRNYIRTILKRFKKVFFKDS